MNEAARETVRSYGPTLDDMMDLAAAAMSAVGYRSRHAPAARSAAGGDETALKNLLVQLGLVCMRMQGELQGTVPGPDEDDLDVLAIYASARRLIALLRNAQESGALAGRAAAELDGDIDEVEEQLALLDDIPGLIDSVRSLEITSRPYVHSLPEGIVEEFRLVGTYLS